MNIKRMQHLQDIKNKICSLMVLKVTDKKEYSLKVIKSQSFFSGKKIDIINVK